MSTVPRTPKGPLVLVVALARNRVIGVDGDLPWHLPADLQRFKRLTMARPMVMGRATYDAIGRPLPGRRSIVITRDRGWTAPGVDVVHDLVDAFEVAGDGPVMIIGGGQIFEQALPVADRLELTLVDAEPEGDTFFPLWDAHEWVETHREDHPGYSFVTLVRREAAADRG